LLAAVLVAAFFAASFGGSDLATGLARGGLTRFGCRSARVGGLVFDGATLGRLGLLAALFGLGDLGLLAALGGLVVTLLRSVLGVAALVASGGDQEQRSCHEQGTDCASVHRRSRGSCGLIVSPGVPGGQARAGLCRRAGSAGPL